MKKVVVFVILGAAGIYLLNRYVLNGAKKDCGCDSKNLEAKVRETTQDVIELAKQPVQQPVIPSVVSQEFSVVPIIPAKTVIIRKQVQLKTPVTMNDMVLQQPYHV